MGMIADYMLQSFTARLKSLSEEYDEDNPRVDTLCKWVRLYTPTIPDIDLDRYLCPECGKSLGRIRNKYFPPRCPACRQIIDWGFRD